MKRAFTILILTTIFFGCQHKINFNDFPEVSYNKDISLIISSNCTQSGCHGSKSHEGFALLTYDDVIKRSDVVAGSPENSKLYDIITTYNKENLMPRKPYSPLSDQQIQKIYLWIGQGAKNN